jgi:membrane protease YdiL (CAAX protease family)
MWGYVVSLPIQIALFVLGFKLFSGATLSQMGLGCGRLGQNYLLGYLGWLVLAPTSLAVFAVALWLTPNPQKHPLLDLGPWRGNLELIAFTIQAAILAPINEELLFRGLLLAWLLQPAKPASPGDDSAIPPMPPERRSDACAFCALLLAFWLQKPALEEALKAGIWENIAASLTPSFFVVLFTPFYLLLPLSQALQRRLGFSDQEVRAWLATSILFAAIHSSVWPSPVPLLALALGLGWLTIRTRSIIPSIVVHMLFNGVSVMYVWLGGGA